MSDINEALNELMTCDGAVAAAIVDYNSGMLMGSIGDALDLELAAAGNTEVVRAKMKTMDMLGLSGNIKDILITLDDQFHLIRPLSVDAEVFIYFVLMSNKANLALARRKLELVEGDLDI